MNQRNGSWKILSTVSDLFSRLIVTIPIHTSCFIPSVITITQHEHGITCSKGKKERNNCLILACLCGVSTIERTRNLNTFTHAFIHATMTTLYCLTCVIYDRSFPTAMIMCTSLAQARETCHRRRHRNRFNPRLLALPLCVLRTPRRRRFSYLGPIRTRIRIFCRLWRKPGGPSLMVSGRAGTKRLATTRSGTCLFYLSYSHSKWLIGAVVLAGTYTILCNDYAGLAARRRNTRDPGSKRRGVPRSILGLRSDQCLPFSSTLRPAGRS
jgi:hypothetical protein